MTALESAASALEPVRLPEFDQEVSWHMCRNAMCDNFGVHYDGARDSGGRGRLYRANFKSGRIECVFCGLSFQLRSNLSIRPLARHFLSLSLPFADCPRRGCSNHGANVFERSVRYRSNGGHQVVCRACGGRFSLGEALHVRMDGKSGTALRMLLGLVGFMPGSTVTGIAGFMGLGRGAYYARLRRSAALLRDYASWLGAGLLQKRFERHGSSVRVQTDVLKATLQRSGSGPRHQHLNLIASVVVLPEDGTYFALAVHPAFLPGPLCPQTLNELSVDGSSPVHARRWECIAHALDIAWWKSSSDAFASIPDVGRAGCFAKSPYAELAHFLVVRKILSRFPRVHYFMDSDRALFNAALVAFGSDVMDGRAEIALFQHDKQERSKSPAGGGWSGGRGGRELDAALDSLAERVSAEMNPKDLAEAEPDEKVRARKRRSAFLGADSQAGGWAWLAHPNPAGKYVSPKSLWLTQTRDREVREGRDLFACATLQSVDSLFASMRSRVTSLGRPGFRAVPGRGFRDQYVNVGVVCAELWIYLLLRNYTLRPQTEQTNVPAEALGLRKRRKLRAEPLDKSLPFVFPKLLNVALAFRLGWDEAQEMTKWVRR